MPMRNVVCISNCNLEHQNWAKDWAKKLSKESGRRVSMSDVFNMALEYFRQHCEDLAAFDQAKENNEPWLERVSSAH